VTPDRSAGGSGARHSLDSTDRILVIAPHPDDETLAVGGLLQQAAARGAAVRVLFLTDGENNPWAQRAVEGRWRINRADRVRWGARRRQESLAALGCLGLRAECAVFLAFPDQGLTDLLLRGGETLIQTLVTEVERWRPTALLIPSASDIHPDHNAAAVMSGFALARAPNSTRGLLPLSYVVHERVSLSEGAGVKIALTPRERETKHRAILEHASQLRLKGRFVRGFARETESFSLLPAPPPPGHHHPLRDAFVDRGVLHVEIARPHRIWRGAPVLNVAFEDPGRARGRLVLALPERSSFIEVRDATSTMAPAHARASADRANLRLEVPVPALRRSSPAVRTYIKLERPVERRLGFFDQAGWLAVRVLDMARSDAFSAEERVMAGRSDGS
jgi:LmbE family N-acetylglucosaminyl deacetylase